MKSAVLVGVGGQGVILSAKLLVNALSKLGYDIKMSEVHGMSQRGGSVSTQIRWGEKVYSPLIGEGAADYLIAFEKMEALRYSKLLKKDGLALINDYEMISATIASGQAEYPSNCLQLMQDNFKCFVLNAEKIALELGNSKCMNVVMVGAMSKILDLDVDWNQVIEEVVPNKFLELNLEAFKRGRDYVK